jgi:predicted dehydrogenase
MSRDSIGVGILGAGTAAEFHHAAILANAGLGARLVALGDSSQQRCAEAAARFGAPCVSPGRLLADPDVDVLCICTPNGLHAQHIAAAARARKHVLVEKPIALTLEDADAAIAACEQAGVQLGVVLQRRMDPLFQAIHRAIEAGDLGDVMLGIVTIPYHRAKSYYTESPWRGMWQLAGGGALINQGIHQVDLLLWYMGDPVSVQACGGHLYHDIEVEDVLSATLRFANGACATIAATTATSPGFPHRVEVYGTRGGIQVEGESLLRWDVADAAHASVAPPAVGHAATAGAGGDARGISTDGHAAIMRDFMQALREGKSPACNGREGRRSLAAIRAIYQAAGLAPQA